MLLIGSLMVIASVAFVAFGNPFIGGAQEEQSFFHSMFGYLAAIVIATIGCFLTGHSPYWALLGGAFIVTSILRFLSDTASTKFRKIGTFVFLSSIFAIIGGLFVSPWNGDKITEDRSDWKPAPVMPSGPTELLKMKWSSTDEYGDWPVSRLMLNLCRIAYEAPVDARKELTEMGFKSETINSSSMNGYVVDAGDDAIVILRGTESDAYDVIQDLRFLKRTNDNGSMHGGFVDGYKGMHDQVQKLLRQYETKRVWITGHSLGGALSIVCANSILEDGEFPIAGIMTFGQPKVVRSDMRTFLEPRLNGKYVFFVNDMDPVTRVVDPYEHFGHMVRFADGIIERSTHSKREVRYGTGLGATSPADDEYVDSLSNEELDALLMEMESENEPTFTEDGRPVVKGYIPKVNDHKLESYSRMLDFLIEGR